MATLKCKMCGGNLELIPDENICECEFCGTRQTVPTADNDKKITLFDRANRLRMKSEFDKASSVYENIVTEFPEEAEAYWGLCLCKYGIEYVDDPATGKKVPTCHRTSFEGIFKDTNFELAQEYSDGITRSMYREEAKEIDRLQKAILEIAQKEDPFDIFICYKETDENGNRTKDSVRAQEIYNELTKEGYKVFFSRITLEDKLGEAYEPYIFSALNSSKIMLAIGTSYDNYNAVWVKNEWSRFLQMMKANPSKKLIPCYSDIDAYDMPEEFSNLQGLDMAKIGFLQDLLRGIDKITGKAKEQNATTVDQQRSGAALNSDNLLHRGFLSLEDQEWVKAKELFDRVLDEDPENAKAYFGMMLADNHYSDQAAFTEDYMKGKIDTDRNYERAKQFADDAFLKSLNQIENSKSEWINKLLKYREHNNKINKYIGASMFSTYALNVDGTVISTRWDVDEWQEIVEVKACDCGTGSHIVGLKKDGTVIAYGNNQYGQCNVGEWKQIVMLAVGYNYTVGLKADGTVVAVGENNYGQCDVNTWNNIVRIIAGSYNTYGIKKDGTVIATGENGWEECDVADWRGIITISSGSSWVAGLRKDGTVIAKGYNKDGRCEVNDWRDIVSVSVGSRHTIGLRSNGTVVATGDNEEGQCDVEKWTDIIAISSGSYHSIGLKSDGSVVATGGDKYGQCNVDNWRDIASISTGMYHTIGLKKDGTVVAAGKNTHLVGRSDSFTDNKCKVEDWRLFHDVNTLDYEQMQLAGAEKKELNLPNEEMYSEEEKERLWVEAVKQFEEQNLKDQTAKEENYQKQIVAWKKKREIYENDYEKTIKQKKELEETVTRLEQELANLKGFFSGKKKRELEESIERTKKELFSIKIPTAPGDEPVRPQNKEQLNPADNPDIQKAYENKLKLISLKRSLAGLQKGKRITFGHYPIDCDGTKQSVSWHVLDKQEKKALILADCGLANIPYNNILEDVTWETCSLRTYMNSVMLDDLFNDLEKQILIKTRNHNPENPEKRTKGGEDTEDYLFVLSGKECEQYLAGQKYADSLPTNYIISMLGDDEDDISWAWCRTPGYEQQEASEIGPFCNISYGGIDVDNMLLVRPACWISIE